MKKRKIEVDLETAKKWYNSGDPFKTDLALLVFTHEELKEPELPTCTEEFYNNFEVNDKLYRSKLNLLETLLFIRDIYRQGWIPDWEQDEQDKWCVYLNGAIWTVDIWRDEAKIFSFQSEQMALDFLANFKDELDIVSNLL